MNLVKKLTLIICLCHPLPGYGQVQLMLPSDSALTHASLSVYVADVNTGEPVLYYDPDRSLTPASILKLVTSATALELLGPDHTFATEFGYTGKIRHGKLDGDIIIKGGGDPAFASPYFPQFYTDFPDKWISAVRHSGIKKVTGRVVTDDSWFDYLPVPSKWLWEDAGNYYGAGVYGASVYDNTYEIHFRTFSDSAKPQITGIIPDECRFNLVNGLVSYGNTDQGYIFAAPYSADGWITGSIPENNADFVLDASIPDPPLVLSKIIDKNLRSAGIRLREKPTTARLLGPSWRTDYQMTSFSSITSPALSDIIEVLNHESVNLYAETFLKELGKEFAGTGSTDAGINVVRGFLDSIGIAKEGMNIVDGSGLSPMNSVTARGMTDLLIHMIHSSNFEYYLNSLPEAGKEGTLKNYFHDVAFNSVMRAKSGSMTRVRSYAGYITARSGRKMAFCMIANDFSGPSRHIVSIFEGILKDIILNN